MRAVRNILVLAALLSVAPTLRAENVVLKSGQRLSVTGYQLLGDKYRLQMNGGSVEIPSAEVSAIEPEDIFTRATAQPVAAGPYGEFILAAANRYHVDADLINSVIAAESNFNPRAISRRNARGLMQLIPGTAARLGVRNIFDPRENIEAGTRYLGELLLRYHNDLTLTLAAYNAGPERVQKHNGVPPYAETISYVRRVKHTYEQRKAAPAAKVTPA